MNSKENITSVYKKILRKIGQNPDERIDEFDQDPEYTSCRVEELQEYFKLYQKPSTSIEEKKVLCCFMLECLNEEIQCGRTHMLQDIILKQLFKDKKIHHKELEYWMNTSDPDEENWWPITKVLLKYKKNAEYIPFYKCPVCMLLPGYLSVNEEKGERLPDEVEKPEELWKHEERSHYEYEVQSIKKCSICSTYYYYSFFYDDEDAFITPRTISSALSRWDLAHTRFKLSKLGYAEEAGYIDELYEHVIDGIVRLLLKYGADNSMKDYNEKNSLDYTRQLKGKKRKEIASILKEDHT